MDVSPLVLPKMWYFKRKKKIWPICRKFAFLLEQKVISFYNITTISENINHTYISLPKALTIYLMFLCVFLTMQFLFSFSTIEQCFSFKYQLSSIDICYFLFHCFQCNIFSFAFWWYFIWFSNLWMHAKSLQPCTTLCDPMNYNWKALLSMGLSR